MRGWRITLSKRALGKGLDALIPAYNIEHEKEKEESKNLWNGESVLNIRINDIDPNPNQPRKDFDRGKIEELALSIEKHGVIQPIIVRPTGDRYMIIAGERRWRAGKLAGLNKIPAIVRELDERQMYVMTLVENLQREDLDPIEEAQGIKQLMDEYDLTQEEIANEVGKSRSAVANVVRLLNLPKWVQKFIKDEKITPGHGRAILALKKAQDIQMVIDEIIKKDLNVRETEQLIKRINDSANVRPPKTVEKPTYILAIETSLEERLGTKVNINPGKKKGIIQIEYYNNEDLERIMNTIAKPE